MEALDPTDRADAVAYLCVTSFGAEHAPTVPWQPPAPAAAARRCRAQGT
jgi:hypothetical protein